MLRALLLFGAATGAKSKRGSTWTHVTTLIDVRSCRRLGTVDATKLVVTPSGRAGLHSDCFPYTQRRAQQRTTERYDDHGSSDTSKDARHRSPDAP